MRVVPQSELPSDLFLTSVSGRCTEPQGPLFGPVMLPTIAASASLADVCARIVQKNRGGGGAAAGVVPPCAVRRMSHIRAPCNPTPCFTYANRRTLCSGLSPHSLSGSEWVRHGYQQQARAALVSASPNKGSTSS